MFLITNYYSLFSSIFGFNYFQILQAFLPSMIEKNHGHVVALSSLAGISGLPNLVPYCASKFAVRGKLVRIIFTQFQRCSLRKQKGILTLLA